MTSTRFIPSVYKVDDLIYIENMQKGACEYVVYGILLDSNLKTLASIWFSTTNNKKDNNREPDLNSSIRTKVDYLLELYKESLDRDIYFKKSLESGYF